MKHKIEKNIDIPKKNSGLSSKYKTVFDSMKDGDSLALPKREARNFYGWFFNYTKEGPYKLITRTINDTHKRVWKILK